MHRQHSKGFTVIELMITLVGLAILVALAAPSFAQWLAKVRVVSQANQLVGDLAMARSESATRGAKVTVCASSDGTSCDSSGKWVNGWLVFVDNSTTGGSLDGVVDGGEKILKVVGPLGGNTTVTVSGFVSSNYVQFHSYGGLSPATAGAFSLCSATISPQGVKVDVKLTGRAQALATTCS